MEPIRSKAAVRAFALAVALVAASPAAAQAPKILPPDLQKLREALDKYKDPIVAIHDGYFSTVACITYTEGKAPAQLPYPRGGMGVHFINGALIGKPIDPQKPQILVYEPVGGQLQLVAAEWFVPISPDMKEHPQLFGKPFDGPMAGHHPLMPKELHHFDLHVWLWKANPAGLFAPTNPNVKCPKGAYTFNESAPKVLAPR